MSEHPRRTLKTFWKENNLSIVLLLLFLFSFLGQTLTGHREHNQQRQTHGQGDISYRQYLISGASIEATFENWESEFLQMGMYVLLTVWLRQKGSAESKPLDEEDESDEDPAKHRNDPDAPAPVRAGGWWLKIYEKSLTLALFATFVICFFLHAFGGQMEYCEQQRLHGEECVSLAGYMATSRFWFESFQNWQSEFLSVAAVVLLSIFLRQKGSPESKPVHAAHHHTGR